MHDWCIKPLESVAEILLSTVDKKSKPYEESIYLCNYMDVYSNEHINFDIDFMQATATVAEIQRFGIRNGDVMITKDSESPDDIGVPSVAVGEIQNLVCGYHLALIKPKRHKIDSIYLSKQLALIETTRYYGRLANGSTRYGLSYQSIAQTPIRLAPIGEQQYITNTFLILDKNIEQTKIFITKMQKIKAGLMQELFSVSAPLTCLNTMVSLVNEKATILKDPNKPYVGLEHLPSEGSSLLGTSSPEEYRSICNVFQKDDILFGKLRPRLRKCIRAPFDGYCSTDILVLRATGVDPRFAGYTLQSDPVFAEAIRTEEGTRMPRCSWSTLRNLEVYCPDLAQQQHIADILSAVDETIEENEALLVKLQQVKAGLMQDLLTGRVRVPAALSPSDTAEAPADV